MPTWHLAVFATLDEEKSVNCLSKANEASIEVVDVYFARDDD